MICPVEIASEVSALRATRVGDHAGHGKLLEGRHGAGHEGAGSDFAGGGEEDHVVASGGDHGIGGRQMRRWRERYEEFGFRGLFDRQRGKPSPKKVPLAVIERVLALYREKYFDPNRHFHEKLMAEQQIELSYSWVKGVLQRGRADCARSGVCIGSGASGGLCPACCCTSMAASMLVSG